ncbi:hypothetical protein BDQ12DRAFT_663614 [Crucibulum laeve]|uniref:Uncharacterized protein n=1 Tax=Crucibulum laeve TaxID=68775 RepID=A0A5C3MAP9_9AGAR|nr:hypothetical protein BDQ12DRAFT_663614 [Crucibulum laeve]
MASYQHQQQAQFVPPIRPPVGWQPPSYIPAIPTGLSINPQQWQAGTWKANPNFNYARYGHQPPPQQYFPAPAWNMYVQPQHPHQQPGAADASFNPYKRVPKPPSAEYLKDALVDNPLGLENMIPAAELAPVDEQTAQSTPWIWAPKTLDEDESDPSSSSSSSANRGHNRTPSQARQASDPTHIAPGRSSRQVSDPTHSKESIPPPFTGFLPRPKKYRRSTDPDPESPDYRQEQDRQRQMHQQQQSRQPLQREESFTSKGELQTTFSRNIIRTPEQFHRSSSRGSMDSSASRNGSVDSRHASSDSLSSHMSRLSTGSTSSFGSSLSRHSSEHSLSGVSTLSEEPDSMPLSPLMVNTPKPHSRAIGRHGSAPYIGGGQGSLSTIDEFPSSTVRKREHVPITNIYSNMPISPVRSTDSPSSIPSRGSSSSQSWPSSQYSSYDSPASSAPSRSSSSHRTSPNNGGALNVTPPSISQMNTPPRTPGQHTTPNRDYVPGPVVPSSATANHYPQTATVTRDRSSHPTHKNPLPRPPEPYYYPITPPHDADANPPPPTLPRRVRIGYWNKRGDHLIVSPACEIVYAPPSRQYPEELKDYPLPEEGYRDERWDFVGWADRSELQDSLPRYGQPPVRPYDSFIKYTERRY